MEARRLQPEQRAPAANSAASSGVPQTNTARRSTSKFPGMRTKARGLQSEQRAPAGNSAAPSGVPQTQSERRSQQINRTAQRCGSTNSARCRLNRAHGMRTTAGLLQQAQQPPSKFHNPPQNHKCFPTEFIQKCIPQKGNAGFLDAAKAASLQRPRAPSRGFSPDRTPDKFFRYTFLSIYISTLSEAKS